MKSRVSYGACMEVAGAESMFENQQIEVPQLEDDDNKKFHDNYYMSDPSLDNE